MVKTRIAYKKNCLLRFERYLKFFSQLHCVKILAKIPALVQTRTEPNIFALSRNLLVGNFNIQNIF